MKDLSIEEKQTFGKSVNDLKTELMLHFDARAREITEADIARKLEEGYEDVTFPIASTGV